MSVFEKQTPRLCWIHEDQMEREELELKAFPLVFFFQYKLAQINSASVNQIIKTLNGKSVMVKFEPEYIMA